MSAANKPAELPEGIAASPAAMPRNDADARPPANDGGSAGATPRPFVNYQGRPPINYVGRDVRPSALYESETSARVRALLDELDARLARAFALLDRAERPKLRVVR